MKLRKKLKDDFDTQIGMPTRLGTMSGVMEDGEGAPTNSAGAGQVAGIGIGSHGEPGFKKSMILRRKRLTEGTGRFAGMDVFEVASEFYHKCKLGKKKFAKYADYVGEDETGEAIRQYGRHWKTKSNPILLQDKSTGHMQFLKYGKKKRGF